MMSPYRGLAFLLRAVLAVSLIAIPTTLVSWPMDDAIAAPTKKRKRSRPRRRSRQRNQPKPKPAPPAPAPANQSDLVPSTSFRGPTRIDFDDRLIQGQSNKSGAVYLFDRKETGIKSMVRRRKSFRKLTISTVYDR